jgi:hypothetical protein
VDTKKLILKEVVTDEEMCHVITEYIFERKGKKVEMNNLKGIDPANPIHRMLYTSRIQNTLNAYIIAGAWLIKNKYNDKENN